MKKFRTMIAVGALAITGGLVYLAGGSKTSPASSAAVIAARGCEVHVSSPVLEPGGVLRLNSGDALALTIAGTAKRCPSSTVTLYAKVGGAGEGLLGTTTTNAAGVWSYGYTATDATTTLFRAAMTSAAGKTTSTTVTIDADTGRPKIAVTSPAADDWGVLRIVAPAADGGCGGGGNVHADKSEPGWVYDRGCAAGGQVLPTITVTGGSPGTLTARYADASLASVPITSSPQTFTTVELGTWTLPDWTRGDLTIEAARQPDGGPAGGKTTKILATRVATSSPPALRAPDGGEGIAAEIVNKRSASFSVAYILPAVPVEVGSADIEIAWITSTTRAASAVSRGSVTVGTTATAVADPATAHRGNVQVTNCALNDASIPVWCGLDPNVSTDSGVIVRANVATLALCGSAVFAHPDAGDPYNGCNGDNLETPTVYCVAEGATKAVTVSEGGMCSELTQALVDTKATKFPGCSMPDTTAVPQVWECPDGTRHAPGEVYRTLLDHVPPLNTVWIVGRLSW